MQKSYIIFKNNLLTIIIINIHPINLKKIIKFIRLFSKDLIRFFMDESIYFLFFEWMYICFIFIFIVEKPGASLVSVHEYKLAFLKMGVT